MLHSLFKETKHIGARKIQDSAQPIRQWRYQKITCTDHQLLSLETLE